MEYFAFGETFVEEHKNSHNSPYKYNGKELDEETGWYYYGARYYDPVTSRFLSVDPLAEKYSFQSPYCYAANNPISLIDFNGLGPDDPPGPGYYSARINSRYIGFARRNPTAAIRIGFGVTPGATNISTNATRFATRGEVLYGSKRSQPDEGSENGAFRHSLWQASITSEFNKSVAGQAGNAHEENPFEDLSKRSFSGKDAKTQADQTVDLLNNIIGRSIGEINKGASMDNLANIILDEFRNNGLYTAAKAENENWVVTKTQLSEEKYNQLKEIFKGLNENGRTKAEQNAVNDAAKKHLEELQQTWGTMK